MLITVVLPELCKYLRLGNHFLYRYKEPPLLLEDGSTCFLCWYPQKTIFGHVPYLHTLQTVQLSVAASCVKSRTTAGTVSRLLNSVASKNFDTQSTLIRKRKWTSGKWLMIQLVDQLRLCHIYTWKTEQPTPTTIWAIMNGKYRLSVKVLCIH